MADSNAVVIDNGTGFCKAGIAGDDAPRSCFPMTVGRPNDYTMIGTEYTPFYVGQEAKEKKAVLKRTNPIKNGIIENWDDMIKVWNHCYYNELKVDPTEQPVHLTEAPNTPKENKEKMMEIFFEDFSVPAFYISIQAVLSLYSTGKASGIVVDCGAGVNHVVPVTEAFAIKHAIKTQKVSGDSITEKLEAFLKEKGAVFGQEDPTEICNLIKESKCFIPQDYEDEVENINDSSQNVATYTLPDGKQIKIGREAIDCMEALFQPELMGYKGETSIHEHTYKSLMRCDKDLREELSSNILLTGGTTTCPGFSERLERELVDVASAGLKMDVKAPTEREFGVWIGGSILSTLPSFHTMWITRYEYDEAGTSVVHRKCL